MIRKKNPFLRLFFAFFLIIFLSSCGPFKPAPSDARKVPPNVDERVRKNIEEGRGFRLMGGQKKGGTFDFASSNELWRATLDTIDFMPLISANYSGGIIITDWYNDSASAGQSVKISIRFLTNEVRSDALDINIFIKKCDERNKCVTSTDQGDLLASLKKNILKKAIVYEKTYKQKNFKPYKGVTKRED